MNYFIERWEKILGKMMFDVTCEINLLSSFLNQLNFHKMIEKELRDNLNDFGEIINFTNELRGSNHLKLSCKINVSPELTHQFETNTLEFIRMMEQDLRLTFNGYGEILNFENGIDYVPDEKTLFL